MQAQKIKTMFFFILIGALLFYAANFLAREPDIAIEDDQSRSHMFLELVEHLSTITFDLDFINTSSRDLFVVRLSNVPRRASTTGRENPFAKFGRSVRDEPPVVLSGSSGGSGFVGENAVLDNQEVVEEFVEPSEFPEEVFDGGSVQDGGVLQFDN